MGCFLESSTAKLSLIYEDSQKKRKKRVDGSGTVLHVVHQGSVLVVFLVPLFWMHLMFEDHIPFDTLETGLN